MVVGSCKHCDRKTEGILDRCLNDIDVFSLHMYLFIFGQILKSPGTITLFQHKEAKTLFLRDFEVFFVAFPLGNLY